MAGSPQMSRKTKNNKVGQRVAMLAHTLYLFDPRVRREAEALAQKGIEVHVIGLSEKGLTAQPQLSDAIVNGVHVHRLPIKKKRGNSLRYLFEYFMTGFLGGLQLAALHFRRKLNAVHVHNMPDILVLAAAVPRLGGSKLVLDIHDPMPELSMSSNNGSSKKLLVRLLRLQEKFSCGLADRVISVNESMRENLQAKGVPDDKIFIVHNFPDQRVFPICEIPSSWPRNRNCLSLLYCGTVTEHYDLALVVKAIARLAGEVPVKLRIVGTGTTLAQVLDLARNLGVADSIELIGVVPLDRVHEEMRKVDVGISCQRGSVFGDLCFSTKIVEYLTQGLPVLTPQTYTVSKYLPADCLFYFEPGNDAALADAIRFMWRNPAEVLRRLSRATQLLPRLSWQAEKDRFLAFYADLLNDARPPGASQPVVKPAVTTSSIDKSGQLDNFGPISGFPKYVLITPAKNEEAFIEKTIVSVIKQTVRPAKWVIVDDGSMDRTAEIVSSYLNSHEFIHLVRIRPSMRRDFGRKVAAFNAGLEALGDIPYCFIGNLDADIILPPDYYATILSEFEREPCLGLAGGMIRLRIGKNFMSRRISSDSVSGGVQLFRRECFDDIGGYLRLPGGGEDAAAEVMARMHGWLVRNIPHRDAYELRRTGTAQNGIFKAMYKEGVQFHSLGYGTPFYLCRCAYRIGDRPFVIGSLLSLLGFMWAKLRSYPVHLPPLAVLYLRSEQKSKLRQMLRKFITGVPLPS